MDLIISYLQSNKQTIVICNNKVKAQLLDYFYKHKILVNVTFKTPQQVLKDILGRYEKEAFIKLVLDEGYHPEVSEIILNNLLLVDNKKYDYPKLDELVSLKEKYACYLEKSPLLMKFYQDQPICLINPDFTNASFYKVYQEYLKSLNPKQFILGQNYNKDLVIYKFNTRKEEVEALAEEIIKLIASGLRPENIKIHNLNDSYQVLMKDVFSFYNLDVYFDVKEQLNEYELTKIFLTKLYLSQGQKFNEIINQVITELKNETLTEREVLILNKIINIVNQYSFYTGFTKDIIPILEYEFSKGVNIYDGDVIDVIKTTNLMDEVISEDDYVFILGINQDVFPPIKKDEDYLLDHEKRILRIATSTEINKEYINLALLKIYQAKNIYLSYALISLDGRLEKSSFISHLEERFLVFERNYQYLTDSSYSLRRHVLMLSKLLDEYYLYDVTSSELSLLLGNLQNEIKIYRTYNNQFTGIDEEILTEKLCDGLNLSFTSINTFFNCPFRYLIERIYKLNKTTNERALLIGNFFHYCFEKMLFSENIDFESEFAKIVKDFCYEHNVIFSPKDQMFLKIYQRYLLQILPILRSQYQNSSFTVKSLEEEFTITLDHPLKPILRGKIDKILTYKDQDKEYAVVLDYKTGSNYFDYNKVQYGLDLQTLIYFYMLNYDRREKYEFAGAYLQSILLSSPLKEDSRSNKTYLEELATELRWNGYTLNEPHIVRLIDRTIDTNQSFLKGVRFKKDGTFDSRSLKNIISSFEFELLMKHLEKKIFECINKISLGDFKINPVKFKESDHSCKYCPYQDICFRKEKDYQTIELKDDLSFIREVD